MHSCKEKNLGVKSISQQKQGLDYESWSLRIQAVSPV